MSEKILQFKRGTAARWVELNPILAKGEPAYEYDTRKFKVGDGSTSWVNLPYVGESEIVCVSTYFDLPKEGKSDCIYKVNEEKTLYQWNTQGRVYEPLTSGGGFDPSNINLIHGGNANG